MEDIFKSREGDREKEIAHGQKGIKELEGQIDELFVSGELEKDSYQRMKMATKEEMQKLTLKEAQLKAMDTSFMKYCRYGLTFLTHLDEYYQIASPSIKKNCLVRSLQKNSFSKMENIEPLDLMKRLPL